MRAERDELRAEVERLTEYEVCTSLGAGVLHLSRETVEQLHAERDRYRAALRRIADDETDTHTWQYAVAFRALNGGTDE